MDVPCPTNSRSAASSRLHARLALCRSTCSSYATGGRSSPSSAPPPRPSTGTSASRPLRTSRQQEGGPGRKKLAGGSGFASLPAERPGKQDMTRFRQAKYLDAATTSRTHDVSQGGECTPVHPTDGAVAILHSPLTPSSSPPPLPLRPSSSLSPATKMLPLSSLSSSSSAAVASIVASRVRASGNATCHTSIQGSTAVRSGGMQTVRSTLSSPYAGSLFSYRSAYSIPVTSPIKDDGVESDNASISSSIAEAMRPASYALEDIQQRETQPFTGLHLSPQTHRRTEVLTGGVCDGAVLQRSKSSQGNMTVAFPLTAAHIDSQMHGSTSTRLGNSRSGGGGSSASSLRRGENGGQSLTASSASHLQPSHRPYNDEFISAAQLQIVACGMVSDVDALSTMVAHCIIACAEEERRVPRARASKGKSSPVMASHVLPFLLHGTSLTDSSKAGGEWAYFPAFLMVGARCSAIDGNGVMLTESRKKMNKCEKGGFEEVEEGNSSKCIPNSGDGGNAECKWRYLLFAEDLFAGVPSFPREILFTTNPNGESGSTPAPSAIPYWDSWQETPIQVRHTQPYDLLWCVVSLERFAVLMARWGRSPAAVVMEVARCAEADGGISDITGSPLSPSYEPSSSTDLNDRQRRESPEIMFGPNFESTPSPEVTVGSVVDASRYTRERAAGRHRREALLLAQSLRTQSASEGATTEGKQVERGVTSSRWPHPPSGFMSSSLSLSSPSQDSHVQQQTPETTSATSSYQRVVSSHTHSRRSPSSQLTLPSPPPPALPILPEHPYNPSQPPTRPAVRNPRSVAAPTTPSAHRYNVVGSFPSPPSSSSSPISTCDYRQQDGRRPLCLMVEGRGGAGWSVDSGSGSLNTNGLTASGAISTNLLEVPSVLRAPSSLPAVALLMKEKTRTRQQGHKPDNDSQSTSGSDSYDSREDLINSVTSITAVPTAVPTSEVSSVVVTGVTLAATTLAPSYLQPVEREVGEEEGEELMVFLSTENKLEEGSAGLAESAGEVNSGNTREEVDARTYHTDTAVDKPSIEPQQRALQSLVADAVLRVLVAVQRIQAVARGYAARQQLHTLRVLVRGLLGHDRSVGLKEARALAGSATATPAASVEACTSENSVSVPTKPRLLQSHVRSVPPPLMEFTVPSRGGSIHEFDQRQQTLPRLQLLGANVIGAPDQNAAMAAACTPPAPISSSTFLAAVEAATAAHSTPLSLPRTLLEMDVSRHTQMSRTDEFLIENANFLAHSARSVTMPFSDCLEVIEKLNSTITDNNSVMGSSVSLSAHIPTYSYDGGGVAVPHNSTGNVNCFSMTDTTPDCGCGGSEGNRHSPVEADGAKKKTEGVAEPQARFAGLNTTITTVQGVLADTLPLSGSQAAMSSPLSSVQEAQTGTPTAEAAVTPPQNDLESALPHDVCDGFLNRQVCRVRPAPHLPIHCVPSSPYVSAPPPLLREAEGPTTTASVGSAGDSSFAMCLPAPSSSSCSTTVTSTAAVTQSGVTDPADVDPQRDWVMTALLLMANDRTGGACSAAQVTTAATAAPTTAPSTAARSLTGADAVGGEAVMKTPMTNANLAISVPLTMNILSILNSPVRRHTSGVEIASSLSADANGRGGGGGGACTASDSRSASSGATTESRQLSPCFVAPIEGNGSSAVQHGSLSTTVATAGAEAEVTPGSSTGTFPSAAAFLVLAESTTSEAEELEGMYQSYSEANSTSRSISEGAAGSHSACDSSSSSVDVSGSNADSGFRYHDPDTPQGEQLRGESASTSPHSGHSHHRRQQRQKTHDSLNRHSEGGRQPYRSHHRRHQHHLHSAYQQSFSTPSLSTVVNARPPATASIGASLPPLEGSSMWTTMGGATNQSVSARSFNSAYSQPFNVSTSTNTTEATTWVVTRSVASSIVSPCISAPAQIAAGSHNQQPEGGAALFYEEAEKLSLRKVVVAPIEVIQSCGRGYKARRCMAEAHTAHVASSMLVVAEFITRTRQGYVSRKGLGRMWHAHKLEMSSRVLQRAVRQFLARIKVTSLRRDVTLACDFRVVLEATAITSPTEESTPEDECSF